MEILIGVDIGGSHIAVNCVLPGGSSMGLVERSLESREEEDVIQLLFQLIRSAVKQTSEKHYPQGLRIRAIGIGCPGQPKDGVVVAAANFPTWKNVPLVQRVQEVFPEAFVCLLKDSDAALAGEIWGENRATYGEVKNAVMISKWCI